MQVRGLVESGMMSLDCLAEAGSLPCCVQDRFVQPNIVTLNSGIASFAKAGLWQRASLLLASATGTGLQRQPKSKERHLFRGLLFRWQA